MHQFYERKIGKTFQLKMYEKRAPCNAIYSPKSNSARFIFFHARVDSLRYIRRVQLSSMGTRSQGKQYLLVFSHVQIQLHVNDHREQVRFAISIITCPIHHFSIQSNSSSPTSHHVVYYQMCGGSNHVIVLAEVDCFEMLYGVLLLVSLHILMLQICSMQ